MEGTLLGFRFCAGGLEFRLNLKHLDLKPAGFGLSILVLLS